MPTMNRDLFNWGLFICDFLSWPPNGAELQAEGPSDLLGPKAVRPANKVRRDPSDLLGPKVPLIF